ncbi:hypothetical protein phiLo_152 [Thermus phage phiLo]|nr:hypothetical protein phiLo_152 [Thermus phage phiLo]
MKRLSSTPKNSNIPPPPQFYPTSSSIDLSIPLSFRASFIPSSMMYPIARPSNLLTLFSSSMAFLRATEFSLLGLRERKSRRSGTSSSSSCKNIPPASW